MARRGRKTPKTASQRLAKSLRALKRQGGKLVSLRLTPQAAGVVRELVDAERYRNVTECVNEAILRLGQGGEAGSPRAPLREPES
ncbi:MAG TPA: hypothetical protein PK042_01560 [Usitatibacteraceae bacterium]|nr:hypothetical protein [Usitatibacteraceae bacterium]